MNFFQRRKVETALTRYKLSCASAFAFIYTLVNPIIAAAEEYQELLLFPNIHAEYHIGNDVNEKPEFSFAGDAFFALNYEHTRFVGEFYLASSEIELERAQFGYLYAKKQFAWVGRFHAPLDFWNNQYSHAAFLQTSVHRPSIIEYEDHGGILPSHMAGLMLEGEISVGESAVEYNFVAGSGTELKVEGLAAVRLLEKEAFRDTYNASLRIGFRPDELATSQYGGFITRSKIVSDGTELQYIEQTAGGLYFHVSHNEFRVIGSAIAISNQLNYASQSIASRFYGAYLHGEYELNRQWVVYARVEDSYGIKNNPFFDYFDEYKPRSFSGGVRYDINAHNALSLEIGRVYELDHVSHPIAIQWSAAYP